MVHVIYCLRLCGNFRKTAYKSVGNTIAFYTQLCNCRIDFSQYTVFDSAVCSNFKLTKCQKNHEKFVVLRPF